ncbi:MAG: hypothetical protein H6737_08890 [Alphaproteobacteria bacterium]|nr:hypothetical protein [Alphaproteobacteria bacterium]
MKKNTRSSRPLLRVAALTAGAVLSACGGDGPQPLPGNPKGSHFDENATNDVLLSGKLTLYGPPPPEGAKAVFVAILADEGPPIAAKKLPVGPFPMDFTITTADVLPMHAGKPLRAVLNVTARIDGDGDAMTDEDLPKWEGQQTRGDTGVEIQLASFVPLPGNPKGSMYDEGMPKPKTDE